MSMLRYCFMCVLFGYGYFAMRVDLVACEVLTRLGVMTPKFYQAFFDLIVVVYGKALWQATNWAFEAFSGGCFMACVKHAECNKHLVVTPAFH